MNIEMRAATPGERLYAFKQSTHIGEHSGAVGCLRGDMGEDGQEFHTDWEHCCGHLWTSEFLVDRDKVLDALRNDERYGGVLKDRDALTAYCGAHPESDKGRHDREYAFRLDTEQYSYFMRLCPDNIEFDFELYPYRRDLFELHTEQAEQGIRFIGPDHRERFTIPDGDSIHIITGSGDTRDRVARYVDNHHVELFTDYNSTTVLSLYREEQKRNRTFADRPDTRYNDGRIKTERSGEHGTDIQDRGRLPSAQPGRAGGTQGRKIWDAAAQLPPQEQERDLHRDDVVGQAGQPSGGDRPAGHRDGRQPDGADGGGAGREREPESVRSDEVGRPNYISTVTHKKQFEVNSPHLAGFPL